MSAEKIIKKILEDAKAEADSILNEASHKAEEIKKQGAEKAKKSKEPILAEAERKAKQLTLSKLALAKLEARNTVLAAKREVLDSVFKMALEKLSSLEEKDYKKMLLRLLTKLESAEEKEKEKEKEKEWEIIVPPQDRKLWDTFIEEANKKIKISETINKGFILKAKNYEIIASFEAVVKEAWEELEEEVAKTLFIE
jgi:vacuolar-type H+-ATPase subunit E/Vma4